jgi:bacillopeptidase F
VDTAGCPVGPVDADGDGFAADLDCNDADASVYPGASEIAHDGIDQDCNGFDLSIDVGRARYVSRQDKLVIWATSSLGAGAALRANIGLQGGGSIDRVLSWSNVKDRWQKTLTSFAAKFGSSPNAVTVYGPEGEVTVSVEQR